MRKAPFNIRADEQNSLNRTTPLHDVEETDNLDVDNELGIFSPSPSDFT